MFADYLQRKASEAARVRIAAASLKGDPGKTVLFHWFDAISKNAEEAKRLASDKPGADGKWEGVKEIERKVCMRKVQEFFRS